MTCQRLPGVDLEHHERRRGLRCRTGRSVARGSGRQCTWRRRAGMRSLARLPARQAGPRPRAGPGSRRRCPVAAGRDRRRPAARPARPPRRPTHRGPHSGGGSDGRCRRGTGTCAAVDHAGGESGGAGDAGPPRAGREVLDPGEGQATGGAGDAGVIRRWAKVRAAANQPAGTPARVSRVRLGRMTSRWAPREANQSATAASGLARRRGLVHHHRIAARREPGVQCGRWPGDDAWPPGPPRAGRDAHGAQRGGDGGGGCADAPHADDEGVAGPGDRLPAYAAAAAA